MFTTPRIIAIALCAALNFAVGSIVYLTKLPIYLDSIGTILCAMLIYPDRTAAFVCAFVAAMTERGQQRRTGQWENLASDNPYRARKIPIWYGARVGMWTTSP